MGSGVGQSWPWWETQFLLPQWSHLQNGNHKRGHPRGCYEEEWDQCMSYIALLNKFSQYCCVHCEPSGGFSSRNKIQFKTTQPSPVQFERHYVHVILHLVYKIIQFWTLSGKWHWFFFYHIACNGWVMFHDWACHRLSHPPYCWT